MGLPIRPGVYKHEFDNSLTMTVGGLGGIGVCGRFEKGEIGVAVDVPDRETLERQFGKSISGYNQEDWMYVDNIFYYTGNIIISRVEETEWKYKRGFFTVPCENAQALIYNKDKIAFNCGNSFNITALSKDDKVRADWSGMEGWEGEFHLVGDDAEPNVFDYSFLVKNHNDDFEEMYKNGIAKKSRIPYRATIDLWDDMDDIPDPESTDMNKYNLTENINNLRDGSLMICCNSERNQRVAAKIMGKQKFVELTSLVSGYEYYWNLTSEGDEVRVFSIKLRELTDNETLFDYQQLKESLGSDEKVMVYDTIAGYKEIGYYIEDGDGNGGLYLNNNAYVFKEDEIIVPLKTSDINNAEGPDEISKIEDCLVQNSCDKYYVENNKGVTYYEISFEGGANIDSKLAFNFIYLAEDKENPYDVVNGGEGEDPTNVILSESNPLNVVLSETNPIQVVLTETAPAGSIVDFVCYGTYITFNDIKLETVEEVKDSSEFCRVIAKTPGKWADTKDIEVMVCPMNYIDGDSLFDVFASDYFAFRPNTNDTGKYAADQIAVVVFVDGSAIEKYICSVNPEAKDADGLSIYWNDMINRSSQYIYFAINPSYVDKDANVVKLGMLTDYIPSIIKLSGGNSSMKISPTIASNNVKYAVDKNSVAAFKEALKSFSNRENVSLEYLCDGAFAGNAQIKDALKDMAINTRNGDSVVVVGCAANDFQGVHYANEGYSRIEEKYTSWVDNSAENQYVAFYANSKQVYDSYNDSLVWISCSSDAVGLNSRVDRLQERWYAVAGTRRGVLTNTIKLGWYPDDTSREKMTKDRFNPIIYERGDGNMIYDTMSMCSLNSDLSEFYNRKTLNYLSTQTESYLKNMLFEINDQQTRDQIVASLTPFYRSVYNRRGLAEPALIQCDGRNNPASVVAQNLCYVDIIIKLTRCIKRLVARYRITAQTASLEFVSEE